MLTTAALPDLLTTGAVARALEKSESTIRKYDREGRLHSMRSSTGDRLFTRDEVERFKAERSRER